MTSSRTPPALVADEAVAALAGLHVADAARAEALEELAGVPPVDLDPAHVRDVEQPAAGTDLLVLLDDARVADGHLPPGEIDHLGAGVDVELVQGCALQERLLTETVRGFSGPVPLKRIPRVGRCA
jgi:hypothetical protein